MIWIKTLAMFFFFFFSGRVKMMTRVIIDPLWESPNWEGGGALPLLFAARGAAGARAAAEWTRLHSAAAAPAKWNGNRHWTKSQKGDKTQLLRRRTRPNQILDTKCVAAAITHRRRLLPDHKTWLSTTQEIRPNKYSHSSLYLKLHIFHLF